MVEILKTMVTSFKRSHVGTATLSARPCSRSLRPTLPLETPEHTWASLGHSLGESLLLSPGSWCAQGSVCALQKSISPVLRKFLWLYGGVNGDPLQEGLRHTQVCSTQDLYPCSSPLLTHTSTGDTQTQFCLSLCRVSGSWFAQGLFEPSEGLWWVWGLILNAICPSYCLAGASLP